MMWVIGAGLLLVWFILKFILHKGGYSHMFVIAAISVLAIKWLAYRNARYHRLSSGR